MICSMRSWAATDSSKMNFSSGTRRSDEPLRQQVAHETGRALERLAGFLALGGVADDGPVDPRQRQVAGDLGAGDRHEADTGIADLGGQHLADLFADLVLNALDAVE